METIFGKSVYTDLEEILTPQHTALIIVDMQNDFVSPAGMSAAKGIDPAPIAAIVPAVNALVDSARAHNVTCIWVQQTNFTDGRELAPAWIDSIRRINGTLANDSGVGVPLYCVEGSWGQDFVDPLSPIGDEKIVKKLHSSAFVNTNLADDLRKAGIDTVVVAGCVTDGCVMATVRDAQMLDFYTCLAGDAVGSASQKMHEAAMLLMSARLRVLTNDQLDHAWSHSG